MAKQAVEVEAVEVAELDTGEVAGVAKSTEGKSTEEDGRFAQLREAVVGLRTRAGRAEVERWALIAGAFFVPLGLVALVLGWRGASQTPYEFEQIPYVISGGLLGVGLMALGGFLYFGYWLTRMVREQRSSADRVAAGLERIEELLGAGVATNGSVRAAPSVRSARSPRSRADTGASGFVATSAGSMFHRPDCVVVEGKSGLRAVTGAEKGLAPCGMCDPLAAA